MLDIPERSVSVTRFVFPIILSISLLFAGTGHTRSPADDLVLMTEQFPPYNFETDDGLAGTSVDLMVEVLRKVGSRLTRKHIVLLPWARGYQTVLKKKNTVLFAMTRTDERDSLFKWVGPISRARNVLIARKDRHIRVDSPGDVLGYRIGAVRDDAGGQLVMKTTGIPYIELDIAPTPVANVWKLHLGRIDLFAYDENVTRWIVKKQGLDPDAFESVWLMAEGFHYFAFNRETPDSLIRLFQNAVDELKANGFHGRILKRYLK